MGSCIYDLARSVCIVAIIILLIVIVLHKTKKKQPRKRMMVVLGSGGHTTEMLFSLKHFNFDKMSKIVFAVANTDKTSTGKLRDFLVRQQVKLDIYQWFELPRSREVKQSAPSAVVSTLKSLWFCMQKIWSNYRDIDVVIMNGPGTCIPIAYIYFILNLLRLTNTKLIFMESWCRVNSLSLTGYLMLPIADRFIVHWKNLEKKHLGIEYLGKLI